MSARLRDLDREVSRMTAVAKPRRSRPMAMAKRGGQTRSMVVDFGEPASFGAGAHAMTVEPAMSVTDGAWEAAISDALAAGDDAADHAFHAAAFASEPLAQEEDDDFGEDIGEIEDDEDAQGDGDDGDGDGDGEAVLAQSDRRAILDNDDRFWSVARAADAARTQLANDPGLADLHAPDDPESEADEELRRDLEHLKQRPVEAAEAPVTAHSIFDNMAMATTFDVGTVAVTRTFDALDAELDRAERVRQRKAADPPPLPPALEVDETVEDLSWIQSAIASASAPGSPAPEADASPEWSTP